MNKNTAENINYSRDDTNQLKVYEKPEITVCHFTLESQIMGPSGGTADNDEWGED